MNTAKPGASAAAGTAESRETLCRCLAGARDDEGGTARRQARHRAALVRECFAMQHVYVVACIGIGGGNTPRRNLQLGTLTGLLTPLRCRMPPRVPNSHTAPITGPTRAPCRRSARVWWGRHSGGGCELGTRGGIRHRSGVNRPVRVPNFRFSSGGLPPPIPMHATT